MASFVDVESWNEPLTVRLGTLPISGTIRVVVKGPGLRPMGGVPVLLDVTGESAPRHAESTATGEAVFETVPAGTHVAQLGSEFQRLVQDRGGSADQAVLRQAVRVNPGKERSGK
jgi:hypothetical protein